jgi:hypothetical protein
VGDLLSRAEIEARFTGEWVLVGDPQTNAALNVQGGRVLHHSADLEEVRRQATTLRPRRFAILCCRASGVKGPHFSRRGVACSR